MGFTSPVWLVPTYSESPAAAVTSYLLDITDYNEKIFEDIAQDGTGVHRFLRVSAGFDHEKISEVKLARGSVPEGWTATTDINKGREGAGSLFLIWKREHTHVKPPQDGNYIVYNKMTKQTVQKAAEPSVVGTKIVCGDRLPTSDTKFNTQVWNVHTDKISYGYRIKFQDGDSGLFWGLEGDYVNPEVPHGIELVKADDTGRSSFLLGGRADNNFGFRYAFRASLSYTSAKFSNQASLKTLKIFRLLSSSRFSRMRFNCNLS